MSAIPSWLARFGISKPGGSWEEHIARGSAGGVDFPAPVGTPIRAPEGGGRLTFHMFADGSSVARVTRSDGTCTEFLHHSNRYGVARDVAGNEVIALSDGRKGAWGANGSNGPHIHVHDKPTAASKVRLYPYSTVGTGGGGGGFRPKPTHVGDDDMPDLYALSGSKPRLYARAGGNPGTPANWIEATDPSVSAGWLPKNNDGVPVGSFTDLSQGTWDSFKAKYLSPVQFVGGSSGGVVGGVTKADLDAAESRITAEVHGVPAAVIVEQKKPGN